MNKANGRQKNIEMGQVALPWLFDGATSNALFDDFCWTVASRYEEMVLFDPSRRGGIEGANRWLRNNLYQAFLPHLEIGNEDLLVAHFNSRLSKYRSKKSGPLGQVTIFHFALRAIFIHDMSKITDHSRRRNAACLSHAYRHFIDVGELDAFLRDISKQGIEKRAASAAVELGYEEHVAQNISEGLWQPERSEYPPPIMLESERRMEVEVHAGNSQSRDTYEIDDQNWIEDKKDAKLNQFRPDWDDDS